MDKQKKEIKISEPRMVKSHDVKLDSEYAEWIAEVKHRYRSAQVKAAVKVNGEKLLFNWQMGRDLVQKKAIAEFEKYRKLEMLQYESDYDRAIRELIQKENNLPKDEG